MGDYPPTEYPLVRFFLIMLVVHIALLRLTRTATCYSLLQEACRLLGSCFRYDEFLEPKARVHVPNRR